jgi:hypothetical protein
LNPHFPNQDRSQRRFGTVGWVITTGGVCLNDEERGQIGGSNVVWDAGTTETPGALRSPPAAYGELCRLLSSTPFHSSSGMSASFVCVVVHRCAVWELLQVLGSQLSFIRPLPRGGSPVARAAMGAMWNYVASSAHHLAQTVNFAACWQINQRVQVPSHLAVTVDRMPLDARQSRST